MGKKNLKLTFEISTHSQRKLITCPQLHISAGGKKGTMNAKSKRDCAHPAHHQAWSSFSWVLTTSSGHCSRGWRTSSLLGIWSSVGLSEPWTCFLEAFLLLLCNTGECSVGATDSLLNVRVGVTDGHSCMSGRAVHGFLLLFCGSGLLCLHTAVHGKTLVISELRCCSDPCRGKISVLPEH